ncbi:MAG: hypothetical protein GY714_23565 [Desulfobacterales bacterium]|nr:hypothetical protein [Desulfobacterales bacterium]
MNSRFVCVPHSWYDMRDDGYSFIGSLGDKRFTIWFLITSIAVESNTNKRIPIQIKQLVNELSLVKGYAKATIVRKLLIELKTCGLIKCDCLNTKTRSSDLIYLDIDTELYITDLQKGFSMINVSLFQDKILKLQPKGFFIYCFLHKYHNINLGNQCSSNLGYAEVNRDYIGRILGIRSLSTVTKYIDKIVSAKSLVKKIDQAVYEDINEFGEVITKYTPNRFIVWAKVDSENKYYIRPQQRGA